MEDPRRRNPRLERERLEVDAEEIEAGKRLAILGKVGSILEFRVASERHVEPALLIEATQAVVSGSIQV
jgi:hypothetical protein